MFISKISIEDWTGNRNGGWVEDATDWDTIEAAIRDLDGDRKTLVTLEAVDETHMAIGGGGDRYVVYVTFDNETFYYLIDPSKSDSSETIMVGGQEGLYAARSCVDLLTVLTAAREFAEVGKLEASVHWTEDVDALTPSAVLSGAA
jgi:hypothetical protein